MSTTPSGMQIDRPYYNRDRVSFSLWRKLTVSAHEPYEISVAPVDPLTLQDIARIQRRLTEAAIAKSKMPPAFELNLILLPDQENKFGVRSYEYQTALVKFIVNTMNALSHSEIQDRLPTVAVRNVYRDLNEEEVEYLDGLQAAGSAADMAKNKAIYRHRHRKHLQIDTNTKIPDFQELYDKTFGDSNPDNHMRFNASYYDEKGQYISVHNKAVYFTSGNQHSIAFGETLQKIMTDYCRVHKDDEEDKKPTKNSIYSKVFCEATYSAGLSLKAAFMDGSERKIRFVANILQYPEEFGLTSVMLTALNQTWASDLSSPLKKSRKIAPPHRYKSILTAEFMATRADYPVWENAVKKFFMAGPEMLASFLPLAADEMTPAGILVDKRDYIQGFRRISNSARELAAAAAFICNPAAQDHNLFYHVLQMGFRGHDTSLYRVLGFGGLQENDVENVIEAIENKFAALVDEYDSDADKAAREMPQDINEQFLTEAVRYAKEYCRDEDERIRTALSINPPTAANIQHMIDAAGGQSPIAAGAASAAEVAASPDVGDSVTHHPIAHSRAEVITDSGYTTATGDTEKGTRHVPRRRS